MISREHTVIFLTAAAIALPLFCWLRVQVVRRETRGESLEN